MFVDAEGFEPTLSVPRAEVLTITLRINTYAQR